MATWYPAAKTKPAQEEAKSSKKRRGKGRKTKKVPAIIRAPADRSNHESTKGAGPFAKGGLRSMVTTIVEGLPEKFSTVDVIKRLEQQTGAEVKRQSVRAVLDRLAEKGVLEVATAGGARTPNIYRKVS